MGTGFGAATTASPKHLVVMAASGMVQGTLYPGGTADLRVAVSNPNTFPVTITGISQKVTPTVSVVGAQGVCEVTGVTVAPQAQTGLSIDVESLSNLEVTVPGAAAMSLASDSGCQGATFQIPVIVTVRS